MPRTAHKPFRFFAKKPDGIRFCIDIYRIMCYNIIVCSYAITAKYINNSMLY